MAVIWTPELDETFRAMRPITPIGEMAAFFGTTKGAIRAHSLLLKIKLLDRNPWTSQAEVDRLIELDDAGWSVAAIARDLKRPAGSVQWKLEDIGRKSARRIPPHRDDEALRAKASEYGQTLTSKQAASIAASVIRKPEVIRRRLAELGFAVTPRAKPWSAADLAQLELSVREGKTLKQTAALLDRQPGAVRAKADRLDLHFALDTIDDPALVARIAGMLAAQPKPSLRSIAKDLQIDPRRAKQLAQQAGVSLTVRLRSKPAPVTKEILMDLVGQGLTLTAAAKTLRRDTRTLKALAASLEVEFPMADRKAVAQKAVRRTGARSANRMKVARVKAKKAVTTKTVRAPRLKSVPSYRPDLAPARKVEVRLDPAPLREVMEVKAPMKSSFGRFMPASAKRSEILDQKDVDEAVRRFIAARGVTKMELSPVDQAITTIRRFGYSVVSRGSGWVLDDRIRIESADDLVEFAQAREARSSSMTMTAT